ncbi:conserved Plasmodium protein, unknown function [Plasmodium gonderi]|uniref:Uncharacterized protein n=1 Tax=Plasmodium gonderi TaxID=77519 RepID=A0A1Y1JKZ0_PLAGO|nr:conserved Plasmodium protein, unknown function [Plasmodium gonderi]GAW81462.1 conserved Plasmodium protein, unknown function [Plasmodium gonderi]
MNNKKGKEKNKDDNSFDEHPVEEEMKRGAGKEEPIAADEGNIVTDDETIALNGQVKGLKEGCVNLIQNYVDPKKYNKFKNDGSFLEQVLALQKKKKVRKLKESEVTDVKKKKSRKTSSQTEEDGEEEETKEEKKENELNEEDEREIAIKNEYLEKINKMKEEGFFTDKGIGAGMVK